MTTIKQKILLGTHTICGGNVYLDTYGDMLSRKYRDGCCGQ